MLGTTKDQGVVRIMGIDPGSRITGYGIIDVTHNTSVCVVGGCIRLEAPTFAARLGILFKSLCEILSTYQPHEMAIEQVFVHKNAASALKLGQARGVAIAAMVQGAVPVHEYAARLVKQAIVGKGGADKCQVQHMVKLLLNLNPAPQADAADALAIALCHANMRLGHAALGNVKNKKSRRSQGRRGGWKNYDRKTTRETD